MFKKCKIIKIFKKKDNTNYLFNNYLVKLFFILIILWYSIILYRITKDCIYKKKEIAIIQTKINNYNIKNENLLKILKNDDISYYIEKFALEELGYAYPDEYRFYVIT